MPSTLIGLRASRAHAVNGSVARSSARSALAGRSAWCWGSSAPWGTMRASCVARGVASSVERGASRPRATTRGKRSRPAGRRRPNLRICVPARVVGQRGPRVRSLVPASSRDRGCRAGGAGGSSPTGLRRRSAVTRRMAGARDPRWPRRNVSSPSARQGVRSWVVAGVRPHLARAGSPGRAVQRRPAFARCGPRRWPRPPIPRHQSARPRGIPPAAPRWGAVQARGLAR